MYSLSLFLSSLMLTDLIAKKVANGGYFVNDARECGLELRSRQALLAALNWVRFAKNDATNSYRFWFGGFRRRTPGPPPFSSMNSMLADFKVGRFVDSGKIGFVSQKTSPPVIIASALAIFEGAHLAHHRSRR
jgi:hypothetical protein